MIRSHARARKKQRSLRKEQFHHDQGADGNPGWLKSSEWVSSGRKSGQGVCEPTMKSLESQSEAFKTHFTGDGKHCESNAVEWEEIIHVYIFKIFYCSVENQLCKSRSSSVLWELRLQMKGSWPRGGFRMGNTCIPVADSFWYLAKLIQFCKV